MQEVTSILNELIDMVALVGKFGYTIDTQCRVISLGKRSRENETNKRSRTKSIKTEFDSVKTRKISLHGSSRVSFKEEIPFKFKIGDRVRYIGDNPNNVKDIYKIYGTIVDVYDADSVHVEYDDGTDQEEHDALNDLKII